MNIIITMAGKGSRFSKAGYLQPKHMIEVCGQTLFSWAMKSLKNFIQSSTIYFVCRKIDTARDFIKSECANSRIENYDILELEYATDGQATTALLAEKLIKDRTKPIGIYNIDTYVNPDYLDPDSIRGEGWIPCFPGPGEHWSFAKVDSGDRAIEVREKQKISEHATIGFYWFKSFDLYADTYKYYYSIPANIEKNERYIAPLYNQLITDNFDVYIEKLPLSCVHGLGTPEEVKIFKKQYSK